MGSNKGLILDIDDTLYSVNDYLPNALKCAVKAMIEAGLPAKSSDEALGKLIEIRKPDSNALNHFNLLCMSYGISPDNQRIIQAGRTAYHNTKFSLIQKREGLVELLDYATEGGYKLGIVSNGREDKQWEKLVRLDLLRYFSLKGKDSRIIDDYVFISDEEGIKKPSPKLFEQAIEKMDLDPKQTISVGDRLEDVLAAHRADIGTAVRLLMGKYKNETPVSYMTKQGYSFEQLRVPNAEINKMLKELAPDLSIGGFNELLPRLK